MSGGRPGESQRYFYPRSPCGERPRQRCSPSFPMDFYPRSPCGERRGQLPTTQPPTMNFYPRSPCGERQSASYNAALAESISIHALLAESDPSGTARHI